MPRKKKFRRRKKRVCKITQTSSSYSKIALKGDQHDCDIIWRGCYENLSNISNYDGLNSGVPLHHSSPKTATPKSPFDKRSLCDDFQMCSPQEKVSRNRSILEDLQKCLIELTPDFPQVNTLFTCSSNDAVSQVSAKVGSEIDVVQQKINACTQTTPVREKSMEARNQEKNYIMETPKLNQTSGCVTFKSNRKAQNLQHLQSFNKVLLNTDIKSPQEVLPQAVNDRHDISATEKSFFKDELYVSTPIRNLTTPPFVPKPVESSPGTPRSSKIMRERVPVFGAKFSKGRRFTLDRKFARSLSTKVSSKSFVFVDITSREEKRDEMFSNSVSPAMLSGCSGVESFNYLGIWSKYFANVKRWYIGWGLFGKIMDVFSWIGGSVRRGFAALWQVRLFEKSVLVNTSLPEAKATPCTCQTYRNKIEILTAKIDALSTKVDILTEEVFAVRKEMSAKDDLSVKFGKLMTELNEIKQGVGEKSVATSLPFVPPPPPPPLPKMALPPLPTKIVKASRKSDVVTKENSRPVISIDDIRKVKLKKIADRASPRRRNIQPPISSEMLHQIKLRPAPSRPHTPSSNPSSLSTSPHSTLVRLLTNADTNVGRVKRLKRTGAYSFDDLYRKNLLRRERQNS